MASQGMRASLVPLLLGLACSTEPLQASDTGADRTAPAKARPRPKPTSLEDWAPDDETSIVVRTPGTLAALVSEDWAPPAARQGPNPEPGSTSVDAWGWLGIFASMRDAGLLSDEAPALLLVDRGAAVLHGTPRTLEPHIRAFAPWGRCVWFKGLDGYASCGVDGIPASWPAPQTALGSRLEAGLPASVHRDAPMVGMLVNSGAAPVPFAADVGEAGVSVAVGLHDALPRTRPVFVTREPDLLSTVDPRKAFAWISGDVAGYVGLAGLPDTPEAAAILEVATGELLVGTPRRGQGVLLSVGLEGGREASVTDHAAFEPVAEGLAGAFEGVRFESSSKTLRAGNETASVDRLRASGPGLPAWAKATGITPQIEWVEGSSFLTVGVGFDAPARQSLLEGGGGSLGDVALPPELRQAVDDGRIALLTSVPFGPLFSVPFARWIELVPSLRGFPRSPAFTRADHLWAWLEIDDDRSVFHAELSLFSTEADAVRTTFEASSAAWARGEGLAEAYAALEEAVGTPVPDTIASRVDDRPAVIRDALVSGLVSLMGPSLPLLAVREHGGG